MEHLEHLDCIMAKYDAALDEVMGAQTYAKEALKAKNSEVKDLYLSMAKQELSHAGNLERMAAIILDSTGTDKAVGTRAVWCDLKARLDARMMDVREKIERIERNR